MSEVLLAELPDLAVLVVRGDDRHTWLQGQVTNDVHARVDTGTLHAFHLDANGKIEAEIRGVHVDEAWYLIVDARVAEALASSLDRRIVMEDASVAYDATKALVGAYGPGAGRLIGGEGTIPVASDRFGVAGFELIVDASALAEITEQLLAVAHAHDGRRATRDELEQLRIAAGMPRFGVDYGAALPQETGLAKRTVSFTKGCYVGQEPVVMLEHRGKPPRRACVVEGDPVAPPVDLARSDETIVGRCTSYAVDARRGLATVKRADAEIGATLHAQGVALRIVALVELA